MVIVLFLKPGGILYWIHLALTFFSWVIFAYCFYFTGCLSLFKNFISCWLNFGSVYISRRLSISFRFSSLVEYTTNILRTKQWVLQRVQGTWMSLGWWEKQISHKNSQLKFGELALLFNTQKPTEGLKKM